MRHGSGCSGIKVKKVERDTWMEEHELFFFAICFPCSFALHSEGWTKVRRNESQGTLTQRDGYGWALTFMTATNAYGVKDNLNELDGVTVSELFYSWDEYEICWVEVKDGRFQGWLALNEDRPMYLRSPSPHILIHKAALKDIKKEERRKKRKKERKKKGGEITTVFYRCF